MKETPFKKEKNPSLPPIDKGKIGNFRSSVFSQLKGYGDLNELQTNVQTVLDTDGELPAAEYSDLYGYLNSKRTEYLDASNDQKAIIKRDLNMMKGDVVAYKNFRQDLAAAINQKAIMNGFVDSSEGKAIVDLLSNKSRLVQKDCGDDPNCPEKGRLGVVLPELKAATIAKEELEALHDSYGSKSYTYFDTFDSKGFRKAEDNWQDIINDQPDWSEEDLKLEENLQRIIKNNSERWVSVSNLKNQLKLVDDSSKEVLNTMANNSLNQSTKANWSDGVEFNRDAAERQIRANLIGKANNFESLIYDEMIPGRNFRDDILQRIKEQTWGSLGFTNQKEDNKKKNKTIDRVSQSLYYIPGVNPEDGIDEKEAAIIVDELINNPMYKDVLDKELVDYYVEYLKRQWVMGEKNRPKPVETKKEEDDVNKDYL